ncbi:MAG: hypothetical protein U0269_19540 [Polyangiales bacterium]
MTATLHALTPRNNALDALRTYVLRGASGEFICASNSAEVHVFLQGGRVAWAVEAAKPLAFIRALKERCSISDEDLRLAFDEGRRTRRPLGETLVQWSLAAWEDICWALEQQLVSALRVLSSLDRDPHMFLDRVRFNDYDERLTFELAPLLELVQRDESVFVTGTFRRPDVALRPSVPAPPGSDLPAISASEVLVTVRGAERVEVLRDGAVIDTAGRALPYRENVLRVMPVLDDGASLVAVHAVNHSFVGGQLAGSRDRLCIVLGTAVTMGAVFVPLAAMLPTIEADASTALALEHGSEHWAIGEEAFSQADPLFAHGEVLAAFVADANGAVTAGAGRASLSIDDTIALIERRRRFFAQAIVADTPETAPVVPIGSRVATRERDFWCLGASIGSEDARRSVWVLVHPCAGLAIGWACLAALARATSAR